MPFTFSHPAIVIPINNKFKNKFDFTALVLGSMAPDFEYFLRFRPLGTIGHTVGGFVYFNLPLCFLFAHIFHYIIKKPLILNLPSPLDDWFYHISNCIWKIKTKKDFFIFMYSAIIGMFSHVLWDGFTHNGGIFVKRISGLRNYIYFMDYQIPVYKLLQHGSTLMGFLIIFLYLYKNRNCSKINFYNISVKRKLSYYIFVIFIAIGIVLYETFIILGGFYLIYLGNYIVTLVNGIIIGITLASYIERILIK